MTRKLLMAAKMCLALVGLVGLLAAGLETAQRSGEPLPPPIRQLAEWRTALRAGDLPRQPEAARPAPIERSVP